MQSLDEEQKRATKAGLSEDELALFDLLQKEGLDRTSRERVKQASRDLLASIRARLSELDRFWEKSRPRLTSRPFFLDEVFVRLPTPPFTTDDKKAVAANVYAQGPRRRVRALFAPKKPFQNVRASGSAEILGISEFPKRQAGC